MIADEQETNSSPPEEIVDEKQQTVSVSPNKPLLRDIFETVLIAFGLFLVINIISARIRVESISMEPTLYRGDFILVEKLSYWLGDPQRGDIVVFDYPADRDQNYIKRVIGLPGDQIFISNGKVTVNGEVMVEPYIKAMPAYTGNWDVPKDSIFVLGDNRNRSNDSHVWGMVPTSHILGKALFLYWPISRAGMLNRGAQR